MLGNVGEETREARLRRQGYLEKKYNVTMRTRKTEMSEQLSRKHN